MSVMPAYIAAEVKRSLMLKMTDSYSAQQRQTAQFQDLFVQRHSNVRSQAAGGHFNNCACATYIHMRYNSDV